MVIKSSAEQFEPLQKLVSLHHSYECPEITAIAPEEMAPTYREWWRESLSLEDSDMTALNGCKTFSI